jgi:hypothetical protein
LPVRAHDDFRVFRSFIGSVNSGEIANLPSARLFVEILGIARFANFERRIDKHFDKLGVALQRDLARASPLHSIRRDERRDHHRTGIGHQFRHFAHSTDVLHAIFRRKPEIRIQTVADVVAVEHVCVHGAIEELTLQGLGDGRFSSAR